MARSFQRRRGSESGAAAVEFALVAPLVMLLLFGTVSAALAYSDHLGVTNAVREGGRFGAAMPYKTSTLTPDQWASSVRSRVQQTYFNAGSDVSTDKICVRLVDSTGTQVETAAAIGGHCGTEPTAPTGMAAGSCAVKVWVRLPETISLVVAPSFSFEIGAASVSYYGLTAGSCTAS